MNTALVSTAVNSSNEYLEANIRYRHQPNHDYINIGGKYKGVPRFTAAYVRDPISNEIHVSYSLLSDSDRYLKEYGRTLTKSRLMDYIRGVTAAEVIGTSFTIRGEELTAFGNVFFNTSVFSRNVRMNVMDFTHAFIGMFITACVSGYDRHESEEPK